MLNKTTHNGTKITIQQNTSMDSSWTNPYRRTLPGLYARQKSRASSFNRRAGILEPFTVITPGKNILINGRERYDVGMEKLGPDYLVPVWLISDELTEEEFSG